MGTNARRVMAACLLMALSGCGQSGIRDQLPVTSAPLPEFAQADFLGPDLDSYINRTVRTIVEEGALGHYQPLDDFLGFAHWNTDLDGPSKQLIARRLLTQKPDWPDRYRRDLETVSAGQFSVVPAPPGPRPLNFPRDDGAHRNLTEWWYYTGHLLTPDQHRYGYELTFFRVLPVVYFAHIAVTDEQAGTFSYSRNFFLPSRTAMAPDHLDIRYQDWGARATGPQQYRIWGSVHSFRFSLELRSVRAKPLLIDNDGYLPLASNAFTFYYSRTRLSTEGELDRAGQAFPVRGESWMDHQWGNFAPGWPITVAGWNWFSVQMNDGTEYNLFELRPWKGHPSPLRSVNIQRPDGTPEYHDDLQLEKLRVWTSPQTGKAYIVDWRLTIPATGEQLRITADQENQELPRRHAYDIAPNYWEGSCRVVRTSPDGRKTDGVGYTEMVHASRDAS